MGTQVAPIPKLIGLEISELLSLYMIREQQSFQKHILSSVNYDLGYDGIEFYAN